MTKFQLIALLLTAIWLLIVIFRFRRSTIVLIGGLFVIGIYTLIALVYGQITLHDLGWGIPTSWLRTVELSLVGLIVIVAFSYLADRVATRYFAGPPNLQSFRVIQQSKGKLIMGIIVAWILGGVLEELIARGIVLLSIESLSAKWLIEPIAAGIATCIAAVGAGIIHSYQGQRAMVIITQLSILFGVLFVVSGYNLWTVILCHGCYDTIAFIRFANRKSKYSNLDITH
jgi:membrane protease YdiL (CAAX protease family)